MKTKTITLYSFDELSDAAKKKALENLRDTNVAYSDWDDFTIEDLQTELAENGFENAKIHYSGFWSQGDGASFDADINLEHFCTDKRILAIAKEHANFRIEKTSYANHYSHEKTRYVEYNDITIRQTNIAEALRELSRTIENERYQLSRKIYRSLEEEYNWRTSDEQIIETIKCNEWTFLENGKLEN
jgi:hypothetical protein